MNSEFTKYSAHSDDGYVWTPNQTRMLRYMLEQDGIQFMRYFFKIQEGSPMVRNWHHYVIQYVLDAVLNEKITRLIINLAPRFTKTLLAVINFIERGLALNPRAKFIHTSYSGDRAKESSSIIKDTIRSQPFQDLWPMALRTDSKSKGRWYTEFGGGMMAAPSGGQITGFGAGRMEKGFQGAFITDDPLKPKDAYSDAARSSVNNTFNNTARSRLALETTPVIVIMQRLHDEDLSGFLLRGNSGDVWHHLSLPTSLDPDDLAATYPEDYTHGIPIDISGVLKAMHTGVPYEF